MRPSTCHFFEYMSAFSIALFALLTTKTYAVERDTTTTWESDRFEGMVEGFLITEQNSIWIGQENRLSHYDAKEGYTHYYARDGIPNKILGAQIDKNGVLWAWGIRKAIFLGEEDVFHIAYFQNNKWNKVELPEILQRATQYEVSFIQTSFQIHFDNQNTLWITRKPDPFTMGIRNIFPH